MLIEDKVQIDISVIKVWLKQNDVVLMVVLEDKRNTYPFKTAPTPKPIYVFTVEYLITQTWLRATSQRNSFKFQLLRNFGKIKRRLLAVTTNSRNFWGWLAWKIWLILIVATCHSDPAITLVSPPSDLVDGEGWEELPSIPPLLSILLLWVQLLRSYW